MPALNNLLSALQFYAQHLGLYDYLALGWVLLVFLFTLVVVVATIDRFPSLGSLLLVADAAFLFVGAYYAFHFVDDQTRKRDLVLGSVRQLAYSDTVILDLNLTNKSQKPFKYCRVSADFSKAHKNKYVALAYSLRPFRSESAEYTGRIDANETRAFKIIIEDFRPKNYAVSVKSECFR